MTGTLSPRHGRPSVIAMLEPRRLAAVGSASNAAVENMPELASTTVVAMVIGRTPCDPGRADARCCLIASEDGDRCWSA